MAEKVVREYFDALNKRDYPRLKTLLTEDYTVHQNGKDKVGWQATIEDALKKYLEYNPVTFRITELAVEGDIVTVSLLGEGPEETTKADQFIDKYRVVDGKISENWIDPYDGGDEPAQIKK